MILEKLNTARLHNLESGQFLTRFFTDFESTGLQANTDIEFEAIYTDLQNQLPTYLAALAQISAKEESEQLLSLDAVRDRKIGALRMAWKVFQNTDNPSKMAAYEKLTVIMNAYKSLASENYEAETLGINNLLATLQLPENFAAVQLLNMEEHLTALQNANALFEAKFSARSSNSISTETYDTKMLRKNIFTTYNELCNYVWAMAKRRNTIPFFGTVLTSINNGRAYFANIIATRKGIAQNKATKEKPTDEQ